MRWYEDFFDTMVWRLALENSLIIGAAATVLATVLGTITALGLSGANFPLKPAVIAILISPMSVPIVIVGVWLLFFSPPSFAPAESVINPGKVFTEDEARKRYLVLEAEHFASISTAVLLNVAAAIWLATILCQIIW